jgi:hypothetical protein
VGVPSVLRGCRMRRPRADVRGHRRSGAINRYGSHVRLQPSSRPSSDWPRRKIIWIYIYVNIKDNRLSTKDHARRQIFDHQVVVSLGVFGK